MQMKFMYKKLQSSNLEMLKKTSGIKDVKEERKDAFSTYVSSHEQQRYHRK